MEQIRQILSQLALHLELNIAMCDVIEDHAERIKALEASLKATKTRLDAVNTHVSQLAYKFAGDAYEARVAASKGLKE